MPKSTKKQKDKSADFKKTKLKLGKGKKPANNAVDTSFKTQSIALPVQSIAAEKSNVGPSTRKKQTLPELVSLLRHYSPGSRKDALSGLRELFSMYNELANPAISTVLPDPSVRKSLLEFLDWYLHILPKKVILPHAATLMLFTTSAQTHIFPEIRVDAVKIIDVLLDVIPEVVTSRGPSGHGQRVFQGYLSLLVGGSLNEGSDITHTSAIILSAQSRLCVLSSLATFLERTLIIDDQKQEPWYLKGSFSSIESYSSFASFMSSNDKSELHLREISNCEAGHRNEKNDDLSLSSVTDTVLSMEPWLESDLGDALESFLSHETTQLSLRDHEGHLEFAEHLLHPVLISVFLDNASNAFIDFNGKQDLTALRLIHSVVKITTSLYLSDLQSKPESRTQKGSVERLKVLLTHFSTYFPFDRGAQSTTSSEETVKHELNIMFCRLSSLVFLRDERNQLTSAVIDVNAKAKQKSEPLVPSHLLDLVNWVENAICAKPSSKLPMGRSLSEEDTKSLLPIVWVLFSHGFPTKTEEESTQVRVLRAIVESIKQPGLHGSKVVFIKFLGMVTLLEKESGYTGSFRLEMTIPAGVIVTHSSTNGQTRLSLIEEFLAHLPKTLWEIGTKHVILTEFLLRYLLRALQRRTLEIGSPIIPQIPQRLIPFFVVQHPTRGPIFGPFRQFTEVGGGTKVQRLALDLVFALHRFTSERSTRRSTATATSTTSTDLPPTELIRAAASAVQGTPQESYWARLLSL